MQHRKRTKVTAALMALCMLVSLIPMTAFGLELQSGSGLSKGDSIEGTDFYVTSRRNYAIAPDISEQVIVTNNAAGTSQTVANVMEVNTSGGHAKIVAGYGNRNPSEQGWTLKPPLLRHIPMNKKPARMLSAVSTHHGSTSTPASRPAIW